MTKRPRRSNEGRSPSPKPQASEVEEAAPAPMPSAAGAGRIGAMALPVLMLVGVLVVWSGPPPDLKDPWAEAAKGFGSPGETEAARRATFLKAASELTRLTEAYPKHARVHYMTAYALINIDDLDGAIRHAREAVRLGSGAVVNRVDIVAREVLVAASLQKSEPLMGRKDYDAALKILMAAREDAPDSLPILINIGNALLLKNDPLGARGYFEKAATLDPRNSQIQVTLATIYRGERQIPQAISALEKAISLNPKDTSAQQMLAQLRAASVAAK
jgi:tetratricopeptide (TPR) repeat protein